MKLTLKLTPSEATRRELGLVFGGMASWLVGICLRIRQEERRTALPFPVQAFDSLISPRLERMTILCACVVALEIGIRESSEAGSLSMSNNTTTGDLLILALLANLNELHAI